MNTQPFITLTGVDESTDITRLKDMGPDVEFGFLYTAVPGGRRRYPRLEWIIEASKVIPRTSLHVCGRSSRQFIRGMTIDVSGFQRIQLNGDVNANELDAVCRDYPQHTIITQFNAGHRLHTMSDRENHAILVDASGGRGISPVAWEAPATTRPVGFAGGLGADNIEEVVKHLETIRRPGWWIDMESSLRDADDWFSVEKAVACVEAFRKATAQ